MTEETTPAPPRRGCMFAVAGVAGTAVAHVIALGVLVFVMLVVVPGCAQIFEDFELALSAGTLAVIWMSDLFVRYFYVVLIGLVTVDLMALAMGAWGPASLKWTKSAWSHVMLVGIIVFLGFTQLAIFLPLMRLFQELS